MTRRIAVVINSRANYARIKSVLAAIQASPDLELQLIIGASALLYRFGSAVETIRNDGFEPSAVVHSIVEGETPTTMAKSTGLAIIELATLFENLGPHIVVTVADRFETLATAVAASYMNIPVAHTQGGESTGSIDDSVRHAVTKLSHIHFPATQSAAAIIRQLGEDPTQIHVTGCPSLDLAAVASNNPADILNMELGVGPPIDPSEPYVIAIQHPVTTEYGQGLEQVTATLQALHSLQQQVVWLWPNVDAGSDDVAKGIRLYREQHPTGKMHFYRNFAPEDFLALLQGSSCVVGNSSCAIREAGFLGVPAVNIGTRQSGRERGPNVVDVDHDEAAISNAIARQLRQGRYPSSGIYGDGNAGTRIASVLASAELPSVQKTFSIQ